MDFKKNILHNKLLWYLFTRYITYFLQFITSLVIAIKLGVYHFGIWGFILLIINYFQILNFGISNSLNILMIQHKKDEGKVRDLVKSSIFLIGIICGFVIVFALYYHLCGVNLLDKYKIGRLFYAICGIGIFLYFNNLFMTIYRVKNALFEVAFYQSIIPGFVFLSIFLSSGEELLFILVSSYLLGHFFSLLLFLVRRKISFSGNINLSDAITIIHKGFFLFIYNVCFYLTIVSTRTFISYYYPIEEFGYFSFAFTLANSILLFLEALSFIIFPKIIDKLNTPNITDVENTIERLRVNYVAFAHLLIYCALFIFPFILKLIPKYNVAIPAFNLIALTILLYTNSFGYNSYLQAQNKEKTIAIVSLFCLIVNVVLVWVLATILHTSYSYVIIATMVSYLIYSYLCVHIGKKYLLKKTSFRENLRIFFPYQLLLPYIMALFIALLDMRKLFYLPAILFLFLNIKVVKEIFRTVKQMLNRPDIINIK